MSQVGLVLDERFEEHRTGPDHPERPERTARIVAAVLESGLQKVCQRIESAPVDAADVARVHSAEYVSRLKQACAEGRPYIDVPDSVICPRSYEIAELAAGAVIRAVEEVCSGQVRSAFCAVRPPGHHAERDLSMGFCFLNNIAIAAHHLLAEHNLERILILDWDVHHCNGTQHTFETDPRVLVISLHGHPGVVYPGTGYAYERGTEAGEGYTINIPMLPGSDDPVYRRAFNETVIPAVDKFRPEFVLVSAGFDAHRLDPLAPIDLETSSFGWMTDVAVELAARHCAGKLVSVLEGGYHLDALCESVLLHLSRLIDG